jgi:hypothetical protein
MALNETVNRVFYVKGEVRTADVTNALLKKALNEDAYQKAKDAGKATTSANVADRDGIQRYSRFDWHFRTEEDRDSDDIKLRVTQLEGYVSDDLTDAERMELRNIGARRSGATKVTRLRDALEDTEKWLRQNFSVLTEETGKNVEKYMSGVNSILELTGKLKAGEKLGRKKEDREVVTL